MASGFVRRRHADARHILRLSRARRLHGVCEQIADVRRSFRLMQHSRSLWSDGMRTLIEKDELPKLDELIAALESLETNHPRELQEWLTAASRANDSFSC